MFSWKLLQKKLPETAEQEDVETQDNCVNKPAGSDKDSGPGSRAQVQE